MESLHFDRLVKGLAARHPRRAALALLATLGLTLHDGEGGTAKKKRAKKISVCNCPSADASLCQTQKKPKAKANKLLRSNPCAYKGKCQGVSGCAATVPLSPLSPPPPGGPPPPPPGGPPPPASTCPDGVTNGNESDVDCGGGTCPRCGIDQVCNTRNDCVTALCRFNRCAQCTFDPGYCGTDASGVPCLCNPFDTPGGDVYSCWNSGIAPTSAPSCAECPPDSLCRENEEEQGPGVRCFTPCRQA